MTRYDSLVVRHFMGTDLGREQGCSSLPKQLRNLTYRILRSFTSLSA